MMHRARPIGTAISTSMRKGDEVLPVARSRACFFWTCLVLGEAVAVLVG